MAHFCAFESKNGTALVNYSYLVDGTKLSALQDSGEALDFGTGYIDFGARQYNPSLRRWMIPDPLSEKFYGISSYAFCNNNPVNLVDPDGQSPIYNISGHLIGTDDEGLQGEAIIMNDDDFTQGMSHSDAISHNLGKEGLSNQSAIYDFETSYASLCQRPDWDGQLTLDEAKNWYNNGIGLPLYVDSSKIDLGNFSISDLDGQISAYYNTCTIVPVARNSFKIPESGLVYGNILVTNIGEGYVVLGNPESRYLDTYDFDIKGENIFRDLFTSLGDWYNGSGIKYNIYTYGKKKVSNN